MDDEHLIMLGQHGVKINDLCRVHDATGQTTLFHSRRISTNFIPRTCHAPLPISLVVLCSLVALPTIVQNSQNCPPW